MKIADLKEELEDGDVTYKGSCHDCGIPVEVKAAVSEKKGEITISGGAIYKIKRGPEEQFFFKCNECFKTDKTLRYFNEIEVWSRSVGYLRPVKQWNKGKQEEYKMRKLFKNTSGM